MFALGIDVGSTNVKAALVGADGGLEGVASRALTTTTDADSVTQDADQIWTAVADAVAELTTAHPDAAALVVAVGVCSQYSSIVPVDADGRVLGPLKMYLDSRGADRCWAILGEHPDAFDIWVDRHGIPPIGAGLSLSHLLHHQHDEPEVHRRTAAYLEVMDLVNLRLTGQGRSHAVHDVRLAADRQPDRRHHLVRPGPAAPVGGRPRPTAAADRGRRRGRRGRPRTSRPAWACRPGSSCAPG